MANMCRESALIDAKWLLQKSAFVAALLYAGCGLSQPSTPPPPPRLVVVYATCSLNKEFLSPYNESVRFTPYLDAFSKEAVVFQRHQTESGQSGTAYASIFTGTQADQHGVFHHPTVLGEELVLLGEAFRDSGYEVIVWLAHGMASGDLGYAQGASETNVHGEPLTGGGQALRSVLDRLAENEQMRALLITNFTVTHGPYRSDRVEDFCRLYPEYCGSLNTQDDFSQIVEFYRKNHLALSFDFAKSADRWNLKGDKLSRLVRVTELLYRANVAWLDGMFGRMLAELRQRGLYEQSLVVFTADHGETLFRDGTHFKWTHGYQLAPEVLNVPLLIHSPGLKPGSYEPVTRSIDIFPTVTGLAQVEPPDLPGVDLTETLFGRTSAPDLPGFSHTNVVPKPVIESSRSWSHFRSLFPRVDPELMWVQLRQRDALYQLRRTPCGSWQRAVFDIEDDPLTLTDVHDSTDPEHRRAFHELEAYRQKLVAAYRCRAIDEIELKHQKKLLRSLGYVQ